MRPYGLQYKVGDKMTSYTTSTYYTDTYLMGRTQTIPTAQVAYYLLKATRILKLFTFNNVDETIAYTDNVQMCCCEIADYVYKKDNSSNATGVTSESVSGHSVSYESSKEVNNGYMLSLTNIVKSWLSETDYLSRAV